MIFDFPLSSFLIPHFSFLFHLRIRVKQICIANPRLHVLARYRVGKIFFYHQTGNRGGVCGTKTAVFHIYCDGDFWVFAGCKRLKNRVILAVWVLRSAGLAAYFYARHTRRTSRTHLANLVHALDNGLKIIALYAGIVFFEILRVYRLLPLYLLDNVGDNIITSVGNGGAGVAYLERRKTQLALPNAQRYDSGTAPMPLAIVSIVIILGIQDAARLLIEVAAEFGAKTKRLHPPPPIAVSRICTLVLRVGDEFCELIAVICVARVLY